MAKKKQDEEQKPNVRTERFQRQLLCDLSREEVEERATEAARLIDQLDQQEADMKAAQKAAKARIEESETQLRRVSGEVRDRATIRLTDCQRVFDWDKGEVREIRSDTGEVMATRPMSDEEKQKGFDFSDGSVDDEFEE